MRGWGASIAVAIVVVALGACLNSPGVATVGAEMRAPDNQQSWEIWTGSTDVFLAKEAAGEPVIPRFRSWDEYWLDLIDRKKKYQRNSERYIDYLVRARHDLGLPEIPGYPYLQDEAK